MLTNWRTCQIRAEAAAPGRTSRTDRCRAGANRNAKTDTATLMTTEPASAPYRPAAPATPPPPLPAMDSRVVVRMASPTVASSSALRARDLTGLGRLLRGTAHMRFAAYWKACPTPRPP